MTLTLSPAVCEVLAAGLSAVLIGTGYLLVRVAEILWEML